MTATPRPLPRTRRGKPVVFYDVPPAILILVGVVIFGVYMFVSWPLGLAIIGGVLLLVMVGLVIWMSEDVWCFTMTESHLIAVHQLTRRRLEIPWTAIRS